MKSKVTLAVMRGGSTLVDLTRLCYMACSDRTGI